MCDRESCAWANSPRVVTTRRGKVTMATYKYCDHQSHDNENGRFTRAVCVVRALGKDPKRPASTRNVQTADSCLEHLGEFVVSFYGVESQEDGFLRVVVDKYGSAES